MPVSQFSGGQVVAGAAPVKAGNTLDVNVDNSSIEVVSDALQVKAAGITNAMLAGNITAAKLDNPNITLASDNDTGSPSFALEGSLTVSGGEGIDTAASGSTITISGEDASTTNKGVASFNTNNFTVTSGVAVTSIDGGSF